MTSLEPRRLFLSPGGTGGGDEDGPGEIDFRREDRRDPREGVLYGVSVGVGKDAAAAAAYSSSVSQAFMVKLCQRRTLHNQKKNKIVPGLTSPSNTYHHREMLLSERFCYINWRSNVVDPWGIVLDRVRKIPKYYLTQIGVGRP